MGITLCVNCIVPLALLGHLAIVSVSISVFLHYSDMHTPFISTTDMLLLITGVLHSFTG